MSGEAEYLLRNELLNQIFDELERDAVETAINAKPSDDEMRRVATQEARAIRSVRAKLNALLRAKTNPPRTGAVV